MQFEVINREKIGVMVTEYTECIPSQEVLRDMEKHGFTFKLDGKRITPREIERLRK